MEFAFDEAKSRINKKKHGLDFVEAQALWQDVGRVEIPAKTTDEPRVLVIGRIGQKCWTAVITYRSEMTRIISVRRSRTEEIRMYES
mgnify:CR=1 FL=1